jgi:hypothetical protein
MRRIVTLALPGLVALALVAQFSQAAHMVLVKHSLCAEHGQLVHGAPGALAKDPSRGTPNSVSALAHDDGKDHEHCPALLNDKNRVVPPASADIIHVVPLPPDVAMNDAIVPVARDVLLAAPKNSPPV